MSILTIDPKKYGRLCADAVPKIIANDREFDRMVEKLEELTFLRNPTPEQTALADLLAKLIQDYDDTHYKLPDVPPIEMVKYLMEQRNLRPVDLVPVFGSRAVASMVLSGKRDLSKAHIRNLAAFFHVGPELFL